MSRHCFLNGLGVASANTARAMDGVPKEIQLRHIKHCWKADPDYGLGVASAIGISLSEVEKSLGEEN